MYWGKWVRVWISQFNDSMVAAVVVCVCSMNVYVLYVCVCMCGCVRDWWKKKKKSDWAKLPNLRRRRRCRMGRGERKFLANQRRGKEERREGEKRRKKNRNGFSTCDPRDPVGFPPVFVEIFSFFRWVTSNHHLENPLWSSLFLLHPKNKRIWVWNWLKSYGVCGGLVYKFFKSWNVFFQLLTPLAFP